MSDRKRLPRPPSQGIVVPDAMIVEILQRRARSDKELSLHLEVAMRQAALELVKAELEQTQAALDEAQLPPLEPEDGGPDLELGEDDSEELVEEESGP